MRAMILPPMVLTGFVLLLGARFAVADAPESAEMAERRKEIKHRQRRIIYNNDGCDCFVTKVSSPEDFLKQRIEPALGTQVDTIFFCTLVTTLYSHDTNVAERWDGLVDAIQSKSTYAINGRDNMRMLRAAGADCLKVVVKRCHEAGVEVFWSHRINDIHDCFTDYLLSQWKRDNPQFLMGKAGDNKKYPSADPRHWWTALDFEKEEVRDYLFRITEEVCQRYDIDGIEIDYFRNPCFFRPTMIRQPVTRAQTDLLTDFQRRITEMAYREGSKRGRPILVAARVPMTRSTCLHVGIDVERWLEDGLLDVLTTGGGYVPFTMPTKELVTLGHEHGLQVYPTISASGMRGHSSIEGWRGAAANAWHAGADGMYLFNTFPGKPKHPHFTDLGDPEALARMDKVFIVDNLPVLAGGLTQGITQDQILPVELDSGGKLRQVTLPVGDDISGAAKAGKLSGAALRIRFGGRAPDDLVEVRLNGEPIDDKGTPGDDAWVSYGVNPAKWLRGDNVLSFRVTSRSAGRKGEIAVQAIELNVTHK